MILCRDCFYWVRRENYPTLGYCKRYPPQLEGNGNTRFPSTDHAEWCGEGKARISYDVAKNTETSTVPIKRQLSSEYQNTGD